MIQARVQSESELKQVNIRTLSTPLGALTLTSDGAALRAIDFAREPAAVTGTSSAACTILAAAAEQLAAYFAGTLRTFDLPLPLEEGTFGTEFQRRVWRELIRIPFGETTTYSLLARRLGDGNATRAVGLANGRNPLAIVVPCHRVIGADGSLTGYAGGLETKRRLLDHEAEIVGSRLLAV